MESNFPQFNRLKPCRHGAMLFNVHDRYIGRSLEEYGEFSEGEIDLFRQFVKPGQIVVEVGANVGAHTVWLAEAVGPSGKVLAFEPQRIVFQTLCANLALNSITNVHAFHAAVGQTPGRIMVPPIDYSRTENFGAVALGGYRQGESVPLMTIDDLKLPDCHFIKIDVEGMEQEVLQGAVGTLAAYSPILYVENDRDEKKERLIRLIDGLGYDMYWHRPPLFNPNNFFGKSVNLFDTIASHNMLCLPRNRSHYLTGQQKIEVVPEKSSD